MILAFEPPPLQKSMEHFCSQMIRVVTYFVKSLKSMQSTYIRQIMRSVIREVVANIIAKITHNLFYNVS